MGTTPRRTGQDIRKVLWGPDRSTFVVGAASDGRGQASIPPRKECGWQQHPTA